MIEYNNEFIEFPNDWKVKKLGDILLFKNGKRPNIINEEGEIPVYGANGIIGYTNDYLINNDTTIIIGRVGAAGKVHLARGKIWVSDNAIYAMNCNESKAYLNFIFYLLSYLNPGKFASKTTHPIITQKSLENLKIPIPPLEEQKKIAEIIDTVDSIITDTTNLIEKLKLLKEKTLNLLITGKIWHKEFKDTEIGKIPKNWEIKRLKDVIIKAKSGGTPRRNIPEYWNGNIPFAKAQDITKSDKYLYNTEEFITEKGLENSNACIVPENSLLLTIYGSIGFVAINKIPVATNQQIIGIIPNKNIVDIEFLYYWYLYFKPYWSKFIKKDAVPHLTLEIVLNSAIPIPPLEEQKKIAEILSIIDIKIETEKKYLDYMKKLKEKLLAALMTGKIRANSISIGDLK